MQASMGASPSPNKWLRAPGCADVEDRHACHALKGALYPCVATLYPALGNGNLLREGSLASPFTDFNSFPLRAGHGAHQELSPLFLLRKLSSEVKLLASSHTTTLGKDTRSSEAGCWTNYRREKTMGEPTIYFN